MIYLFLFIKLLHNLDLCFSSSFASNRKLKMYFVLPPCYGTTFYKTNRNNVRFEHRYLTRYDILEHELSSGKVHLVS